MQRLAVQTPATKDIHAAASILTSPWTADQTRNVFFRVWFRSVAGSGAYSIYLKVTPAADSGTTFVVQPTTSVTLAAGAQPVGFTTIPFPAYVGDVIDIWALGQSGDTAVYTAIETWDDCLPNVAPGASTGLLISGTNAGTTTLGALTVTGALSAGSASLGNTAIGTLTQTGAASLGVGSTVTFATLAVTGAFSVGTTTTLSGAVSLGSTLGVTGTTTLAALTTTGTVTMNARVMPTFRFIKY